MSHFRAVALALLLIAVTASSAPAQSAIGFCGYGKVLTPAENQIAGGAAYQQINVSTTAVSLTVPRLTSGAVVGATIQILNGLVNFRVDGTAPTQFIDATSGDTIGPGGTTVAAQAPYYVACGSDMNRLQMIQSSQSATSPTVNIRYYAPGS